MKLVASKQHSRERPGLKLSTISPKITSSIFDEAMAIAPIVINAAEI